MSINAKKIKKIPDVPGVYFFLGPLLRKNLKARPNPRLSTLYTPQGRALGFVIHSREVLYIGKAGSLRDRVRSYFSRDITETRGAGIQQMIEKAEDISFQKTDSVLEAVLLEAELIKKYQPKYNVREKDDKSFSYVVITKEDFPRILLVRGRELALSDGKVLNHKSYFQASEQNEKTKFSHFRAAKKTSLSYILNLKSVFGPFPQAGTLREALVIIRKIFPFRDKCVPPQYSNILQNIRIRGCFNRQIGLCPGICTGEVSKKEYAKTVQNVILLFKGKKKTLLVALARDMKTAAKAREFERAGELRNTIFALTHIQDVSLIKREPHIVEHCHVYERSSVYVSGEIRRIEAYDVAHTSGKEIVGVMTVVYDGEPEKSAYRKFVLRTVLSSNDPAALKEVLERRLTHAEWPFPDLVVVDGGKAQVNVACRALKESGVPAEVVGVVKDEHHRPKKIIGDDARKKFENEILLANSEAHRFAVSFHRERMRKREH